jgi:spoIIIJ-associated protein
MLDYLGLDASVKSEEKNGNVSLTVFSEDAGRIIGRKGLALQSLQLLLNRIIAKGNRECPRIFIDVDGYKKPERRPRRNDRKGDAPRGEENREERGNKRRREIAPDHEEQLTKKAMDAAKEVKRWGESVTIPPMNAHDRRVIHVTLDADSEIATESVAHGDDDRLKSIIVSLKQ